MQKKITKAKVAQIIQEALEVLEMHLDDSEADVPASVSLVGKSKLVMKFKNGSKFALSIANA